MVLYCYFHVYFLTVCSIWCTSSGACMICLSLRIQQKNIFCIHVLVINFLLNFWDKMICTYRVVVLWFRWLAFFMVLYVIYIYTIIFLFQWNFPLVDLTPLGYCLYIPPRGSHADLFQPI